MSQGRENIYSFSLVQRQKTQTEMFVVLEVEGYEALSQCFRYEIELLCLGDEAKPDQLIGFEALLRVTAGTSKVIKRIHGIVTTVTFCSREKNRQTIRILLEPKLANLLRTRNSRVFQNQNPVQIVRKVLVDYGIESKYVKSLILSHLPPKPLCIQFEESDLHFVQRVLQEHGIFYLFKHFDDHHVLLLSNDSTSIHGDSPTLTYKPANQLVADQEVIYEKNERYSLDAGSILICSYRFSAQNWNLNRPTSATEKRHRQFLFADAEMPRENLENWSNARIAELRASDKQITMLTTSRSFSAGDVFVLSHVGVEIQQYFITEIRQQSSQQGQAKQHARLKASNYRCELRCVPLERKFLPNGLYSKPKIHSVLTAVVVAPDSVAETELTLNHDKHVDSRFKPGDVYCDSVGRVLLQFTWQHANTQTDKFWTRVSYPGAGDGHGLQYVPRIGDIVLVSFINGDPDSPIIVGSVFGDSGRLPYSLPKYQTRTVLRGQPVEEMANELSMEDMPGRSNITLSNAAGHRLRMDENEASVTLESAAGHGIDLFDAEKKVRIRSEHGHAIQLDDAGDGQSSQLSMESSRGNALIFDDEDSVIRLHTPGGNRMELDDKQQSIELTSANNFSIQVNEKEQIIRIISGDGASIVLNDNHKCITLSDGSGQMKIEMGGKKSNIRLTSMSGNIEISAPEGDISLNAKRILLDSNDKAVISSESDVEIEAGNNLKLSAANLFSEAEGEYALQAQLIKLN